MTKKYEKSISMTKKMLDYVRDKKPDHLSRSAYIEEMFWRGVRLTDNNRELLVD